MLSGVEHEKSLINSGLGIQIHLTNIFSMMPFVKLMKYERTIKQPTIKKSLELIEKIAFHTLAVIHVR